jgi:three-Cys-motif partner protein
VIRLEGCPCGEPVHGGNCDKRAASDGLPVQCVGEWAKDKHDYLRRYIDATWATRARFIPPRNSGGAAFIDLFAGPGLACVRETGEIIEGSPLIALRHTKSPFSRLILCELDSSNVAALRQRTAGDGRVEVVEGDCNARVDAIMRLTPTRGLNIALVDPFAPSVLHWTTLKALGQLARMDLIIHFPTGTIKRNLEKAGFDETIDRVVGTTGWRADVRVANDAHRLIDHLRTSLVGIGYTPEQVRSLPIENSRHGVMYHLMFASKHDRGNKIWNSVARTGPGGQRGFDFQ